MDSRAEALSVGPREHVVLFYSDDAELTRKVGHYLLDTIRSDGAAIVVAGWEHRLSFARFLVHAGIDTGAARRGGAYAELDAAEALGEFVVFDHADAAAFWSVITPVIRRAVERGKPVRIFGEMVALLWEAGFPGAAIEVEAMWNELAAQFPFSLVCAYPADSVVDDGHSDSLTEVCRAHSAVAGQPPSSMRGRRY